MDKHIQLARTSELGKEPLVTRLLVGEIALNNNIEAPMITTIGSDGEVIQVGVGRHQVTVDSGGTTNVGEVFNYSGNTASGHYSHAEGASTKANGHYSHAEGETTNASGFASHSEGFLTKADGYYSHAEGLGTEANNRSEHASGSWNKSISTTNQDTSALTADTQATLFSIGNGEDSANRRNALEVKWNGDIYINKDNTNIKLQDALGKSEDIDGKVSKSGDTMTGALNIQSTLNVGNGNTVTGEYAFAQGQYCTASGAKSHAEGQGTEASGDYSHTEGLITIANGESSHAEGYQTIANNLAEHASGSYNNSISGTSQEYTALTADAKATLFSVGNGDSTFRKNAFELKWNGDAYFSGDTKFAKGITANTISANTITSPTIDNINNSISGLTANTYTKTEVDTKVNDLNTSIGDKQDTLVSGTNIKTINGTTLLGSGDMVISADTSSRVAKSGDTMTGALNIETTLNIGSGNTVTGIYAFAQGYITEASGAYSHAEGENTTAIGECSHAEGYNTTANGDSSHSEGSATIAYGKYSHAEGINTLASSWSSHAEGYSTTASENCSHAEGSGTTASGMHSHAEGDSTRANGECSHAEGSYTTANNLAEHASGCYNKSISGTNQDTSALTADTQATLFSVGNGTDNITKRNALEVKWNGDAYFSGDTKFAKGITANTISANTITSPTIDNINNSISGLTANTYTKAEVDTKVTALDTNISTVDTKLDTKVGELNTSIGTKQNTLVSGTNIKSINGTTLLGSGDMIITADTSNKVSKNGDTMTGALNIQSTLNIGSGNTVTGKYAFAQGGMNTASGIASHAEGSDTEANGTFSHAEGDRTRASGDSSHSEGQQTIASGQCSHAEGSSTTASSLSCHAEGSNTIAAGDFSHAEGYFTQAIGNYSHTEGMSTIASGSYSHAEGDGTITSNRAEHASGNYNNSISGTNQSISALTADTKATLFSVGNGEDSANRRNVLEVKWNGDAYFSGDTKFAKGVTASTISANTIISPTITAINNSISNLTSNVYNKTEVDTKLLAADTKLVTNVDELNVKINTKQNTLVSGTDIKTINGSSILGSGDLIVSIDIFNCGKY